VQKEKTSVGIKYHYLKKLSGKNYHPETIKSILQNLGFEIAKESIDEITVLVPFHKTDISIPADLVEEIMRIDGLDNVEIPKSISLSPGKDEKSFNEIVKERTAQHLVGLGLQEIFTNSITHSQLVDAAEQNTMVKMMNNLSAELDVMRTNMFQTGLQSIAYNLNRKQQNLQFFEFGRTYHTTQVTKYEEKEHLAIYVTGERVTQGWQSKAMSVDFYYAKALAEQVLNSCGVEYNIQNENGQLVYSNKQKPLATVQEIETANLKVFEIKQPVFYIDIFWDELVAQSKAQRYTYKEVSKFPPVERDIAIVLNKNIAYETVEKTIYNANVKKLKSIKLFDLFESEKLGADKKSFAINLTFVDEEKTLTDKETEGFVQKIISNLEKEISATLR
jgi:phenylalanyl-tRNA synthetase beta chain